MIHPGQLERDLEIERTFDATHGAAIDRERHSIWGPKFPQHWSGLNMRERSRKVGLEAVYVEHYAVLSAHAHGGLAGFQGLEAEAFQALAGLCLLRVAELVADSQQILVDLVNMPAVPVGALVDATIAHLRGTPGCVLADLRLQSLGEPQRFFLFDDEEDETPG